ncbi:MAG: polysaccharide pyruvyl transferase family protein [Kosmotogaceae bacterium]|nr:polysaccharide pyruvyl transferase family protein [Kosmotogaceae bacterium]
MRQFSFGGLTLVGYYGYDNLGDDLLLLSSLSLIEEIGFEGPIYLPASPSINHIVHRFPSKLDIRIIKRFSIKELRASIKNSILTVFGGGNLLQDMTSWRSFLYYYEIAKYTLKKDKPLLFLSQGFGPVGKPSNRRALNKLLNDPLTYGVMRDAVSYKHFASISNKAFPGTDYGPYYLLKNGIIPEKREKIDGLAVIVLKNGTSVDDVLHSLRLNNLSEVCAVGFHNHHDEEKRSELESKARSSGFKVKKPPENLEGMIEVFNNAELIITERLHGAILAISLGVPFVWKKNTKLDRFVRSLDKNCNLFFEESCESLSLSINSSLKKPVNLKKDYWSRLESTVNESKEVLKKLLVRR